MNEIFGFLNGRRDLVWHPIRDADVFLTSFPQVLLRSTWGYKL